MRRRTRGHESLWIDAKQAKPRHWGSPWTTDHIDRKLGIAAETSETSPEGAALQAASWLATIPYGAVKVAYALGGGIVGGLAWVVTGGSTAVAKAVWIPSMTGDYIVQPQHLTGEKLLHFVDGSADNSKP